MVIFSPDGELVACLVYDNTTNHINTYRTGSGELLHSIRVYTRLRLSTGGIQPTPDIEHSRWVNRIAFSPDGTTIASCASDKAIRFWDVENGTHLRKLETEEYYTREILFSPDGQTITGMSYGFINQWNVETGKELLTIPTPSETGRLTYTAFSADGTMAAMGFTDGTVRVWDVANRTQLHVLKGHTVSIDNVAFSSDGRTLASSASDGTTLLWDITPIILSPTVVKLSPAKVQSPAIGEHLTLSLDITEGTRRSRLSSHRHL